MNALITITSRKPQFRRSALIAAVSCWSMIVAGWALIFVFHPHHSRQGNHNPGFADIFAFALMGSGLLFAIGLVMLIIGGIDIAIRSWQYRRDLRSLADSVPISKPQP